MMRDRVVAWMVEHAHEYANAVILANVAIAKFNLDDDDTWIWDEAQIAFDTRKEGKLTRHYA